MASEQVLGEYSTLYVEEAQTVLGKRLLDGSGDQVREGYVLTDPTIRVLITLTGHHAELHERMRERLALDVEGIAPLRWLGDMPENSIGYDDVLIEQLPRGCSALELAPLPEPAVIRLGIELAGVLARAHAKKLIVIGVTPELVYMDREQFTGLVPRSRSFIATAPQLMSGPRSYMVPFDGYETLGLGKPSTAASDVFALCATLHVLATGRHPFGRMDSFMDIIGRVLADAREPYPGSAALGGVLARGMAKDPAARPSASEIAAALART